MKRREFISRALLGSAGLALATTRADEQTPKASDGMPSIPSGDGGIRVRFLGSGASGWKPAWGQKNPNMRRQSSVLLDGRVLIDFTFCGFDLLPKDCHPEVLFQTHSHGDHYEPDAAVRVGVRRVYVNESWASAARAEIGAAAARLGRPAPEVIALPFGTRVVECGLAVTGVPANHSTSRVTDGVLERTSLYLVEKGATRLLYATDTAGIPGDSARMIGIDPHVSDGNFKRYPASRFVHRPQPLTAIVMEATDGKSDEDFRMFVHSGVPTVARTVRMLKKHGRYTPPEGQRVYLTHLGLDYRDKAPDVIRRDLPPDFEAASDGLEITLK